MFPKKTLSIWTISVDLLIESNTGCQQTKLRIKYFTKILNDFKRKQQIIWHLKTFQLMLIEMYSDYNPVNHLINNGT